MCCSTLSLNICAVLYITDTLNFLVLEINTEVFCFRLDSQIPAELKNYVDTGGGEGASKRHTIVKNPLATNNLENGKILDCLL
jgi:hypothetical protein